VTEAGTLTRLLALDEANSTHAPDGITAAALFYIALPNLIFFSGWLRPVVAIPMMAMTLFALFQHLRREDICWNVPQSPKACVMIVIFAFAWASLGGAGHFFAANHDWLIRDKVLGDLTFSDWPPAYSVANGHPHILRSALGFFLPAAVVGKLVGISSVDLALYLYTSIGCSLFLLLLPLPRKAGGLLLALLLVTIFFSGMDYFGIVLATGFTPIFPLRLEWWGPFSYPSLTGQMHWAPNHALPIWLTTVLFYRHWGHNAWPALFVVLLPLTVLWTPFAVAGIFPFLALGAWRWFQQGNKLCDSGITFWQLAAAASTTWLMVRLMTLDISAIPSGPTAEVAPNPDTLVLDYLLFILTEFAILALLLARNLRKSIGILWLASTVLCLLPLYKFGPSNDTMLRLSTPSLIFLLLITLVQIQNWVTQRTFTVTGAAISLILLIGACTPFNEMWRAFFFTRTLPDYARSLIEAHSNTEPPHYVGRLDRPDLITVLRTPALVPNSTARNRQLLEGKPPPSAKPE
jgi:hypothetical protein